MSSAPRARQAAVVVGGLSLALALACGMWTFRRTGPRTLAGTEPVPTYSPFKSIGSATAPGVPGPPATCEALAAKEQQVLGWRQDALENGPTEPENAGPAFGVVNEMGKVYAAYREPMPPSTEPCPLPDVDRSGWPEYLALVAENPTWDDDPRARKFLVELADWAQASL